MSPWMGTRVLASLQLPDVPATRAGIILRANRDGWLARPRAGRGGGKEYHYSSLPLEAQAELFRRVLGNSL